LNDSALSNFGFSVSTVALCKDGLELLALLGSGKESADPDNLLEALLFANLQDDFFRVTKLAGRELVTPVDKKRNVGVPGFARKGSEPYRQAPKKVQTARFGRTREPKN
jgi:hypothetical protein